MEGQPAAMRHLGETPELRVPIESLRLGPNVTAGMNVGVVMSLWHLLRSTTEDPPPVVVQRHVGGGWKLIDGRHRVCAAWMAGRRDVLAVEKEA